MERTYVVTGAASGIGAAVAAELSSRDGRVVTCDLHDADVCADLTTATGRDDLYRAVAEATGGVIDGIVAVAGIGTPDASTVRLNYFGALATLEGLRPLLVRGGRGRAVVVSSLASIMPADDAIVDACLAGDEAAAVAAAEQAAASGKGRIIYGSTKRALNGWVRRTASTADWAGSGVPLNAVAPGVVDTPGAREAVLDDPVMRDTVAAAMPQPLGFPGDVAPVASLLAWLVSDANSFVTGQVIFADGGADAALRGDALQDGTVRYTPGQRLRLLGRYLSARVRYRQRG